MPHNMESIFVIEYFREYESIFKIALALELESPGVLFNKRGMKISWYCPFQWPNQCDATRRDASMFDLKTSGLNSLDTVFQTGFSILGPIC
jgi:hypothetical protein